MEKKYLYGIIVLLLLIIVAMGVSMLTAKQHTSAHDMSMNDMVLGLQGKEGDAFDKAFIELMIPHHQGAVDMAELALEHARHQELKDLAETIIAAQNTEIAQMHSWYSSWGYGAHAH